MDASAEGFRDAIAAGTLPQHLQRKGESSFDHFTLIVFDDLPLLEDRMASLFSDWIDSLIEQGIEVIIITTPHEDSLGTYQSDRLNIEGSRLVASQKWNAKRLVEALDCFFAAPIPRQSIILAALMMLMGRGIVDNLRELGYVIPAASHTELMKYCPFIDIDEKTGYFNALGLPVAQLSDLLLALLNEASCCGETGADAGADAEVDANEKGAGVGDGVEIGRGEEREAETSETERCFERLTQLSVYLFERAEREQSQLLLELAGSLLTHDDAGFPLVADRITPRSSVISVGNPATFATTLTSRAASCVATDVCVEPPDRETVGVFGARKESEMLIIRLFGDFEILRKGVRVEGENLQRRRVRTLLTELALNMGRGVSRETLLERIWPEMDHAHAKENFYATWSRLSRLLAGKAKPNPYLTNDRGICRLEPSTVIADVHEFEQLSRLFLFGQGSVAQRIEMVYQLEHLYRGDILSGCGVDATVQAARQRYRCILVDVMLEAAKLFSQEDNDTSALWFARKAYDADPAREDVYRILMAVQDRAGQRTNALRTYFDCKRFLGEELGILPSQKTTALYQDLILDRR
jgi:DNA-binding SARP family transcriptional activator